MMIRGKALNIEPPLLYGIIAVGAAITGAIVFYAYKKRKKSKGEKVLEKENTVLEFEPKFPFKITKSVTSAEAFRAREELKILDLEREILSNAIRRLYEAHAEGKITEEEREQLARTYKERMKNVKEAIAKNESIVALHELEAMQEDLIKLFNERFDELSRRIEELRAKVPIEEPIREITPIPIVKPVEAEIGKPERKKRRRKPRKREARVEKPPTKTEAEKRIEEIRAEVEKVLERLGQMEIET